MSNFVETLLPKKSYQSCEYCQEHITLVETIMNKCKCKNAYCKAHKIPENHECAFNYKIAYATQLTSNMPLVKKNQVKQL
jgi:predicted nucleic acid binding AN1-type Zn finger protein